MKTTKTNTKRKTRKKSRTVFTTLCSCRKFENRLKSSSSVVKRHKAKIYFSRVEQAQGEGN